MGRTVRCQVNDLTVTLSIRVRPTRERLVESDCPHAVMAIDAMLDVAHPVKVAAAKWARATLGTRDDLFNRERWKRAAEHGILGLRTPEEFGGSNKSTVEALLTFEGIGVGCEDNGMVFALASQVFAMQTALVQAGSDVQQKAWLPALCKGEAIGSFAMSELEAGSDTASIGTTAALLDNGSYRLDGAKSWVTLGPEADVVIVFATTDRSLGNWGLTAFLVPTDADGLTMGPSEPKSGLNNCPFCTLHLDNCVVPANAILGVVGAGSRIFSAAVEAERAFLYAAQLGAMERTLANTIERARSRVQFGKPIGSFQAVSHLIVEMKLRHEASRLLVYKAAALHDRGDSLTMAAALAKLQTSESAVTSSLDAIRIFGAQGYAEAGGIEVELRDAVGGLAYSGTSDIQRNIVARLLGVDRPNRAAKSDRGEK